MNIKDSYLHGGTHVMKNIQFSIAASGTNQNKLVATITWAEEGSSNTELAIPISGATFGSLTKNTVFAAPNGSAGVPSFRALVADDIPNLGAGKITSGEFAAARLPLATNSAKGAVILGVAKTSDADSAITDKKYWVKMNANGKLFVDIPWTDHTYTVNNAIFSIKSKIGTNDAVTLSDFTANLSAADDFTLILGSNITFTNDATNRTLTIAGTPNTTYKLTLNGTVKGTTGGTDLGTFYAIATSDTSTANQVWMRNSSNNGYGWRTLGSRAFDSTAYVPIAGGTISNNDFAPLFIQRNHTTNAAAMGFKHYSSGTTVEVMGYIGMSEKDGALKRWDGAASTTYIILDSGNSSVSKSGETLTVKINGTSQSLTNTNTWRGIQNNLTSDSTTDSLSAAQGKALANGSARDSTKLPKAGGEMTGAIKRFYNAASNDPMIALTSNNLDVWLWRINHGTSVNVSTSAVYGFGLKYIGTGDGENSNLVLYADALTGTQVAAMTMNQNGVIKLSSTPNVNGTNVSLVGHKHAYTDLTGSSTTANQAIVSNGTANGWTLKTLGSRAFDSTAYLPLAGGTMNTGAIISMVGNINSPLTANDTVFPVMKIALNGSGDSKHYVAAIFFGNEPLNKGFFGYERTGSYDRGDFVWGLNNEAAGSNYATYSDIKMRLTKEGNLYLNGYIAYHSGNIPSNSASAKGVVPAGVASSVYMTDASKNPSWTSIDTTVTSGSSHLVTSGAVYTAIANNVASAVQYQGTITSEADMIALTSAGQGDFARVTTAFTFTDASGASVTAHVGDVVYLTNNTPGTSSNWIVAHTEIDTNTWTAASTSAAGYVPKLATGGANLAAASTDYVLAFTNGATSPSWLKLPANAYKNDNTTGIKLATVSGTKKADSTLISIGSETGLSIAGGTNKFSIGNGTNYIEVSVAHGLSTKNISINGTNYALYTSASSLPTIKAPTGFGTANLILATNADANGLTWVDKPATNVTTSLYVGASNGTSTAAQTAGNVYLILKEGSTYTRYNITGTGRASVTSDANGKITINSSGYSNFVKSGSGAAAGLVPAPSTTAGTGKFLCEDGTWKTPSYTTNTDKTGIKLAAVSGTQKTDGTVIITNSSTGLSIAGGTNKFSIGDGTNYIEVAITPSITNNVTGSGTSGKLVKWNGTNTITDGPALSSSISSLSLTTKFLREDGTWAAPSYTTDTVRPIYTGGTSRFTSSQKTAINFVGAGATSVTFLAVGTGEGQSGNANYASIKISSNNDLVKFSAITAGTEYYLPVRAKNTTDTAQLLYRTSIIVKDSTITATLSGNATTASNLLTTSRGFLYVNANNTVSYSGYGTRDTSKIGIPYVHHTSTSNDTYVLAEDLFYKSGSDKYIGNNIRSNKFACVKSKDSTTDDWDGSSTSGSSGSGSTTYSAGDGISINNGTISTTKKEWFGTEALFNSLASLDSNTTYYIMN